MTDKTEREELVKRYEFDIDNKAMTFTVRESPTGRFMLADEVIAALTAQPQGEPVAVVRRSMTGGNAGLSRHVEITADFILNDGELLYTHPPAQRDGAAVAELKNIVNAKRFDVDVFEDDTQFADWAQSRARHILSAEEPKCQCLELHPDYCHVHAA